MNACPCSLDKQTQDMMKLLFKTSLGGKKKTSIDFSFPLLCTFAFIPTLGFVPGFGKTGAQFPAQFKVHFTHNSI